MNFTKILQNVLGLEHNVTPSPDEKYDLQINVNKLISQNKLEDLMLKLKTNETIETIFEYCKESAGRGHFLCFAIKNNFLIDTLTKINKTGMLNFTQQNQKPKLIIYDYSSPNMSKDMHVGHLRSTIIGDALANISEYMGDNVIRLNHLGDFGLPFGMILEYVIMTKTSETNLQAIYTESKKLFNTDDEFKERSYLRTALLQNKSDEETNIEWDRILNMSLDQYKRIYKLLNISTKLEIKGESFYVNFVDECKSMLEEKNMLELDDTRTILKVDGMQPLTFIKSVEKGNAYTYDTTDIVALWYRTQVMKADEIYYVVDNRQSLHFSQVFKVGEIMGWLNNKKVMHVEFGTILGKDGKPLQSRLGDTPRLLDLIEESVEKVKEQFKAKNKDIEKFEYEINALAVGSLKYQDYSKARTSDYKFNSDQMLKFDTGTFTFVSYTLARIRGIMDHLKENNIYELIESAEINQNELIEIDMKLIRKIMFFLYHVENTNETKMIHGFVEYISKLCTIFNNNYTNSRYLNFDTNNKLIGYNLSKLVMCKVVMNILNTSCKLLGLQMVNVM